MNHSRIKPYLLTSIIIIFCYIILLYKLAIYPFGNHSLLTIDLNQQYFDFFHYYQNTLLHHHDALTYSFEKGIGGEMIGLWAYYLLSPFNLIFLLVPKNYLIHTITLILLLKVIAMSSSFIYYLQSRYTMQPTMITTFALSYSLMSYLATYFMNLMWLDGLIFLPIIVVGLEKMLVQHKPILFVLSLSSMMMINYYMAFMIAIFLAFFTIYLLIEHAIKNKLRTYGYFLYHSIVATLIASVVLLPTFNFLRSSKQATQTFTITAESNFSLTTLFSKLFNSSFVFDEVRNGAPPLYMGSFITILLLTYFMNRQIAVKEKVVSLVILLFFILSLYFKTLNQLWHGGQNPIWYPYRYSFIISFFILILVIKSFQTMRVTFNESVLMIILCSLYSGYYLLHLDTYRYLSFNNIIGTLALSFLIIMLLYVGIQRYKIFPIIILSMTIADLALNTYHIMREFNYNQQPTTLAYQQALTNTLQEYLPKENEFYRIYKNFARTKNESLALNYYGLDHFSSTIDYKMIELYQYLGLAETTANAVYTSGTVFTDDFFNIAYFFNAPTKTDYPYSQRVSTFKEMYYPKITTNNYFSIHENMDYFGLAIETSADIVKHSRKFIENDPIHNQELLLQLIDYHGIHQPYFTKQPLSLVAQHNNQIVAQTSTGYTTYQKVNQTQSATLTYQFEVDKQHAYYLTLPRQFDERKATLLLNEQNYIYYSQFRNRQVMALPLGNTGQQTLSVQLLNDEFKANQPALYAFDLARYQQLTTTKQAQRFNIESFSHNHIIGNITIQQPNAQLLFSMIYDPNWQVYIDGKQQKITPVFNGTLFTVAINSGYHQIVLKYLPKSLIYGSIMSVIGLFLLIVTIYRKNHSK